MEGWFTKVNVASLIGICIFLSSSFCLAERKELKLPDFNRFLSLKSVPDSEAPCGFVYSESEKRNVPKTCSDPKLSGPPVRQETHTHLPQGRARDMLNNRFVPR